jgi:hypothetical protein
MALALGCGTCWCMGLQLGLVVLQRRIQVINATKQDGVPAAQFTAPRCSTQLHVCMCGTLLASAWVRTVPAATPSAACCTSSAYTSNTPPPLTHLPECTSWLLRCPPECTGRSCGTP